MGGATIIPTVPLLNTTWQLLLYTAVGSAALWAKWGRTKLKAWLFSDIIGMLPLTPKRRLVIEFFLFLALGCIVGIGVVNPTTPAQALTAGFGWTGLFAQLPTQTDRSKKRIK